MIKIEHIHTCNWEAAIRGMRNPMNSWDKSDSGYGCSEYNPDMRCSACSFKPDYCGISNDHYILGPNDLKLALQLAKAGTDHGKFLRQIIFSCDITAPMYWISEHDTYKVGTTRNSCSFQHKGSSKEFSIRDFSINDERIYEILDPIKEQKEHFLYYEDSDVYGYLEVGDRRYKVYTNGKIFSCPFSRIDSRGIKRTFKEKELIPHKTPNGYYELNLGGRVSHEKWLLHRIVAEVFMKQDYIPGKEINHKDGNKGNNNLSNLEWVTRSENMKHTYGEGITKKSLRSRYVAWRCSSKITRDTRKEIITEYYNGNLQKNLSEKYGLSQSRISEIIRNKIIPETELFETALVWEETVNYLNYLRDVYKDLDDYSYFVMIRSILPSSYMQKYTWTANYEVLRNIYHARKNHKLDEWHEFCHMIEKLPYSELITEVREK